MAGRLELRRYIGRYHSNSIFFRNSALILLLVAVPLVVMSLFTFRYNQRIFDQEIKMANTHSLLQFQGSMDILRNEIERVAALMSNNQRVVRFYNLALSLYPSYEQIETLQAIMADMKLIPHNYIYSICVYSDFNNYLLTSLGGGRLQKWDHYTAYKRAREPKYGWELDFQYEGRPEPRNIANRFITYTKAYPVEDIERRLGLTIIQLDITKVVSFLFGSGTSEQEILFCVDERGTVILSTERNWTGKSFREIFEYGAESFDPSSISTLYYHEVPYVFSYIESNGNDWTYCSVRSREEYFRMQSTITRVTFVSLVFSLVISFIAAFFISLYVFKPIHEVITMLENPGEIPQYENYNNELKFIAGNIVHNYDEYQGNREEIEKRVAMLNTARVRALQAQINPHFLNNTLQLVNWSILKETGNEDSEAVKILEQLADLVRVNMKTKSNLTSLSEEAEYVSKYMAIQKKRYGERIAFEQSVPEELGTVPVLKMLLQPIIENALYHGLKKKPDAGIIRLSAQRLGDTLVIEVEDDGLGMKPEEMAHLNEQLRTADSLTDSHIGLVNVSLRLRLVFGQEASIRLSARKAGGMRVSVVIPVR